MKVKKIVLALAVGGLTLFTGNVFGQEQPEMSRHEFQRNDSDSVEIAQEAEKLVEAKREQDADRLSDAKEAEIETKAIAKETRRVDREATQAAREARLFLRAEKKAQKARKDAEKQSKKADKAKIKSDKN